MKYPTWRELAPADQAQAHEYSIARACVVALNSRKAPTAAGPEPDNKMVLTRKLPSQSGVPFVYRNRNMWQVRIPGVPTVCFKIDNLDLAREYVAAHVEGV